MPPQSLRILTLDGAGIKGLSELFILQHLFQRIKSITGLRDIAPCDIFDLIAGSSTGGLVAIFLGRMAMDIDDALTAYIAVGEKVFSIPKDHDAGEGKTKRFFKKLASAPSQSRTKDLMEGMMGVLSETRDVGARFCVEEKIEDEEYYDDHSWRVMLSVTRKGRGNAADEPDLIRNWRSEITGHKNYVACVWEAAGAICAVAPWFGESVRLEMHGERLLGGGKERANPIADVLEEMGRDTVLKGHSVGCLVSVGAGKLQPDGIVPEGLRTAVDMMSSAEEAAVRFEGSEKGRNLKSKGRYFRFNQPITAQGLGIDECSDVDKVKAAVERYVSKDEVKELIEECAKRLAETVKISDGKVK